MKGEEACIEALHEVFRLPLGRLRGITRCSARSKAKVPGNAGQKRGHAGARIEDVSHRGAFGQVFQEGRQHRAFSRADLSRKHHEGPGLSQAPAQVGQGLLVPRAQVEKARVRR